MSDTDRIGLQPLAMESTASLIAAQLRKLIGHGTLAAGGQLVEKDIADQLGVSRGPVREAMQRLAQEGLLVGVRNRGVFVAEFGDEDIRDVYEARTGVEKVASALALSRGRARAGDALLECARRMDGARLAGDHEAMTEAGFTFHETLVALAASPRLSRMHATLLTETRMCLNRLRGRYADEAVRVDEHRAIAEAWCAGRREDVLGLLEAHKEDALRRLIS